MKKDRKLSTIEMTMLGMAWLRGPCTIYALMKELAASESTFHRSRAGTAYSVSNRLIEAGLLAQGEGGEGLVSLTQAGKERLAEWIQPPIPLTDIAHSADLIRLRFFFLGAIEPARRIEFIDSCLLGLNVFLAKCEELLPQNEEIGDYFGVLATASVILETRARIQWLELVRRLVEQPLEGKWAQTVLDLLGGSSVSPEAGK